MQWNKFNIKKPAQNSIIIASDGKSIGIFNYPNQISLHSTCCCLSLQNCVYWIYLSDLQLPNENCCPRNIWHEVEKEIISLNPDVFE